MLKYTFMTESAKGTAAIVLVSSDSASAQASQASLPVRPEALVAGGMATFGLFIGQTPARRTPDAAKHLLALYRDERQGTESVRQWAERVTVARLTKAIEPFTTLPGFEQDPKQYEDLGAEGVEFKLSMGKGECAS